MAKGSYVAQIRLRSDPLRATESLVAWSPQALRDAVATGCSVLLVFEDGDPSSVTVPTSLSTAWDIGEEHLDAAAFLLEMRQDRLQASDYSLEELRDGPEARLLAHLDGLLAGGAPVRERVLVPVLEDPDAEPSAVSVSAMVLLEGGTQQLDGCLRRCSPAEERSATRWSLRCVWSDIQSFPSVRSACWLSQ